MVFLVPVSVRGGATYCFNMKQSLEREKLTDSVALLAFESDTKLQTSYRLF